MRRGSLLPGRLLIDLPNWVGDQVMALPAVDRLVRANEGGLTVLHCRPPSARLHSELFHAVRVVASPRPASPFGAALRLCRNLRPFELGVTMRHAFRAKLLLRLVSRHAFASCGGGARVLLTRCFPVDRGRHQILDTDSILTALGLPGVDPAWRPVLPARLREEGAQLVAGAGLPIGELVGLAPGSACGPSKRWPPARFGQLAVRLRGLGLKPLVVVGPGEAELGQTVAGAAGGLLPVLGAEVDVAGLAGLLAHLALLVGNDSGPLHLAAMVGTPSVALFGPTDPTRTAPVGAGHLVVRRGLSCAPCLRPRCPLGHTDCLHGLAVEEVARAVLQHLGEEPAAAVGGL